MSKYAKAIAGAIASAATAYMFAIQDPSANGSAVTTDEWLAVIAAAVAALGTIWVVPNKPSA